MFMREGLGTLGSLIAPAFGFRRSVVGLTDPLAIGLPFDPSLP